MDIHVKILFSKFTLRFRNNRGVTAIEYAIIAGSIAIVIIGSLDFIGDELTDTLFSISDGFTASELNDMESASGGDGVGCGGKHAGHKHCQ